MAKEFLFDPTSNALNRSDYRPSEYLIDKTYLYLDLDTKDTVIRSLLHVRQNPALKNKGGALILDGNNLTLSGLKLNGKPMDRQDYIVTDKHLIIKRPPAGAFTLEVETHLDPSANTSLQGIYMAGDILASQCEAQGFRNITYHLDRPDVLSKFRVAIEADKAVFPTTLSNGNKIRETLRENGKTLTVWDDPFPKPTYLFAIVGGKLEVLEDTFTTMSGKQVDLRIFVQKGYEDKIKWAMESTKRSMKWDEDKYGREYDLDCFHIVAVDKFNSGAMENKGLNIFNVSLLVGDAQNSTDSELISIEAVIGHEYFHNWTGDRVTVRDWFELTLKEGLTVLRDRQFTEDMHSPAIKRIEDAQSMKEHQFSEDSGPSSHPIRPDKVAEFDNIYTDTVYEKGSHVLGMLKTIIGDTAWRAGMDEYFKKFDGKAVTCDDFVDNMQTVSGTDLTQFRRWYSQSGTPEITYEGIYDRKNKIYTLTLRQHTPATADQKDKQALHIPLSLGLIAADGSDMLMDADGNSAQVLHLTQMSQTFVFPNIAEPPAVSLNRGFSAPVKIKTRAPDDELVFRMAHDSDPYNKNEAFQQYALKTMLNLIDDHKQGKALSLDWKFIKAFGANLESALGGDKSFAALMLTLPGYNLLSQEMQAIDPAAIRTVTWFVGNTLATTFKEELAEIHAATQAPKGETYAVTPKQVGRRALNKAALYMLSQSNDPSVKQTAQEQYKTATNMTERLAALYVLAMHNTPERAAAMDDFYSRFKTNPNVITKWLSLEAGSGFGDVHQLMQHEAFDITNPNKLRAVISGFTHNHDIFHAKNGSGYKFVADIVIKMNEINPKVAARIVDELTLWSQFDAAYAIPMKAELERIIATPNLASDVREIVANALKMDDKKAVPAAKQDSAKPKA